MATRGRPRKIKEPEVIPTPEPEPKKDFNLAAEVFGFIARFWKIALMSFFIVVLALNAVKSCIRDDNTPVVPDVEETVVVSPPPKVEPEEKPEPKPEPKQEEEILFIP